MSEEPFKVPAKHRLSDAQLALLRTTASGDLSFHQRHLDNVGAVKSLGRTARTLKSLRSRGLITRKGANDVATDLGREALDANGVCPSGAHGIDWPGQRCDLCEPKRRWTLVLLRDARRSPPCPPFFIYSDVHPLDADELVKKLSGRVLTMSIPIIDRFYAYSEKEVQERIRVVDAAGVERGLTDEEARVFWRRFQAGVQHVSEILISTGIWR